MNMHQPRRIRQLICESLEHRTLLAAVIADIELVSIGDGSGPFGNNSSTRPAISGDGRYVAFVSDADNLTPDDLNAAKDVFVKDLHTGALTLVSTAADGTQGNAPASPWAPSLSFDGRYVAFASRASNLVANDRNKHASDIFVKDLKTGTVTLASTSANGEQDLGAEAPALTPDGRYVVYAGSNGAYRKDLRTGDLSLVAEGYFYSVSISDDGRFVAYDNWNSVFVKDMTTGDVTLASSSSANAPGNGSSFESQISANGRYVTFGSYADNLSPLDGNGPLADIFVKDLETGDVRLVSNAEDGGPANDAAFESAISADGAWVVFTSDANNLVPGDGNLYGTDVFVRNLVTGKLTLLTHDDDGTGSYFRPAISANGRYIAFDARNDAYVPGDANTQFDVFRVDLHNGPQGNVRTQIVHDPHLGDLLVMTGDAGDNGIHLESSAPAEVLIKGLFGTTIDGVAAAVTFVGIHSIQIELGFGDDTVSFESLSLSGRLQVLLGEGDDSLVVGGGSLGGLFVDAGDGMDVAYLASATVQGSTEFQLGRGNDVLTIVDSVFANDVIADGGLDYDVLMLFSDPVFLKKWRRLRFEYA